MNRIFEILFNQMDTLRTVNNPGWKPPSHHMNELSKLPPHLLRHILEGYSAAALQDMARARGLDPLRKRANLEQDLSNHFYDISAIRQAINRLSAAARE